MRQQLAKQLLAQKQIATNKHNFYNFIDCQKTEMKTCLVLFGTLSVILPVYPFITLMDSDNFAAFNQCLEVKMESSLFTAYTSA